MFRSIVFPLDGSSLTASAIPYAALVAAPGARITLISATDTDQTTYFIRRHHGAMGAQVAHIHRGLP